MTLKWLADRPSSGRIPQAHALTRDGGDDRRAIGRERGAETGADIRSRGTPAVTRGTGAESAFAIPSQSHADLLFGKGIPQEEGIVLGLRKNAFAVGREGDSFYRIDVPS